MDNQTQKDIFAMIDLIEDLLSVVIGINTMSYRDANACEHQLNKFKERYDYE